MKLTSWRRTRRHAAVVVHRPHAPAGALRTCTRRRTKHYVVLTRTRRRTTKDVLVLADERRTRARRRTAYSYCGLVLVLVLSLVLADVLRTRTRRRPCYVLRIRTR